MLANILEALLVSAYALILNTGALAVDLLVFSGRDALSPYLGFGALLLFLASCAVFGTVLIALRTGPIESARRGMRVGLAAALVFYALILILFGIIPVFAYLPTGNFRTAIGYLGEMTRITIAASHGIPVVTGALGGAVYGWIRSRRA